MQLQTVMLYLRHDFYNIIFKIKHKLYIASGSAPPKDKLWLRTWSGLRTACDRLFLLAVEMPVIISVCFLSISALTPYFRLDSYTVLYWGHGNKSYRWWGWQCCRLSPLCIPLQPSLAYVNHSTALVAREGYHVIITTNICANSMARRL